MQPVAPVNWLRIAVLGVIWGASFMFISLALTGAGPLTVAAVRITLGALFLVALAFARGRGLPPRRGPRARTVWGFALAMAMFSNAMPFALLGWGQQWVASGFAGVCMSVVPLLILPLAHVLVPGERMTLRRFVGFALGSAGVIVLIGPSALAATGGAPETLARLACVGAACCYAVGAVCTRLCPEVNQLSLAAATLLLASLIITPLALIREGLPEGLTWLSGLALLYLGLLPTGLAQWLLVLVNREAGPVFFGLVNYQVPVWSVIFGAAVLAEPLPPSLLLALAMILSGVALSQLGGLRRLFGRG